MYPGHIAPHFLIIKVYIYVSSRSYASANTWHPLFCCKMIFHDFPVDGEYRESPWPNWYRGWTKISSTWFQASAGLRMRDVSSSYFSAPLAYQVHKRGCKTATFHGLCI